MNQADPNKPEETDHEEVHVKPLDESETHAVDASEEAETESAFAEAALNDERSESVAAETKQADSSEVTPKPPTPPPPTPPPPTPPAAARPAAARPASKKATISSIFEDEPTMNWYILKVAFNREDSIAEALQKRVQMEGMTEFFGDIVVPTEDVATFTRDGKRRVTKRKLLPGYIMVNMVITEDTWFLVRETGGISDFTGSAGKPMPMEQSDIERFVNKPDIDEDEEAPMKTAIPFRVGDRVRVKEGNFENQEGDVDTVDEANGRVTVIINIFGRSVPMELDHWQVEPL